MSMPLLRWEVDGPYDVVFSTRVGGVSEGPFESLNLGRRTGDEVERVDENRRRLCAEVEADEQALTLGFQTHSTRRQPAEAGSRGVPGDALWTDEPGVPMLALGADCVLIAIGADERRGAGARRRPRGLARPDRRRRRNDCRSRSAPGFAAVVGPSIGPCCYEVGEEVASRFRDRFGDGIVSEGKLDLWTAAEQAARGRGREPRSSASTSARAAARISSSRSGARAGRGDTGRPWRCPLSRSPRAWRGYARKSARTSTIVAATKYVTVEDMAALAEAGIEIVGENRAQDLEAKHAAHGDAFRWHFIGHLQSRKAKLVNGICELVHSLDSASAAKRLEIPALIQVNLAGEEVEVRSRARKGSRSCSISTPMSAVCRPCRRSREDPEASRPYFRKLRELAEEHGLTELSMGTSQDYAVAAEEGATMIRIGSVLYQG